MESEQTPVTSLHIGQLSAALAKAQGMIAPPKKDRTVDFIDRNGRRVFYTYADLADVIECFKKPLSENGLAITHRMEYSKDGKHFGMVTHLLHSSGESISTWYPLPDPGTFQIKPQEFGSALTYARRYSVSALLGIASEEDDDGKEANDAEPPKGVQNHKPPVSTPKIVPPPASVKPKEPEKLPVGGVNSAQLARMFAIAGECGWTKEEVKSYMNVRWKIESSKELTRVQYDELVLAMQSEPKLIG